MMGGLGGGTPQYGAAAGGGFGGLGGGQGGGQNDFIKILQRLMEMIMSTQGRRGPSYGGGQGYGALNAVQGGPQGGYIGAGQAPNQYDAYLSDPSIANLMALINSPYSPYGGYKPPTPPGQTPQPGPSEY
jgi:hypothetical protein